MLFGSLVDVEISVLNAGSVTPNIVLKYLLR
jgi:hypothetical protein